MGRWYVLSRSVSGYNICTYWFSIKTNIQPFFFIRHNCFCRSHRNIFWALANFINGELVGKTTDVYWGVIFPQVDNNLRHPSQLYEAFLEGIVLFIIMNLLLFKKDYKTGTCSYMFLIIYGIFRIFSEFFREPDLQIGFIFGNLSMGMLLSLFMIFAGSILYFKKNDL